MKMKIIVVILLAISTLLIVRSIALAQEITQANIGIQQIDRMVQLKFEPAASQATSVDTSTPPITQDDEICASHQLSAVPAPAIDDQ